MSYTDFSLDAVCNVLELKVEPTDLFDAVAAVPGPEWLRGAVERGTRQVLLSEKARSEFIVAPILLACQEISATPVSIYSGVRLDVDSTLGLIGECDFF